MSGVGRVALGGGGEVGRPSRGVQGWVGGRQIVQRVGAAEAAGGSSKRAAGPGAGREGM